VTNWAAYDVALRQRGSLTVWFTETAIAARKAEPRATRGGQPRYSSLAITSALTLRAVFRLALRQTEGLMASLLRLLGLDLAAPDHSTISRRGETLPVSRPRAGSEAVHLLVDSTGLKLCGPGEWLVETHAAKVRRSWRKLHIGVNADTGEIIAAELTSKDVDDGLQVGPLLEQIAGPVASFTGDGAYDRDDVYREVCQRHPDAAVIVPPRSGAVPSAMADSAPTSRDRHLQLIAERGRMGWQRVSGYNWRALMEADIGRYKRVIGDALRSRTKGRQMTEVAIAVASLNRMLELGYRGVKLKTGAGTVAAEADRIGAVRRAIGDEPLLMLDMNAAYDLPDCIDFARAVEPHQIFWLEEPLHWYLQPTDFARLSAATPIPLAHGERELTRFTARDFLSRAASVTCSSTRPAPPASPRPCA
jgi:hypothetical protein